MEKILHIGAKILSIICYPLLIPTYGLILYFHYSIFPFQSIWKIILYAFVLTTLLPLWMISMRIWRNKTKDIYMENRKERTIPYLYTLIGYAGCAYFFYKLGFFRHIVVGMIGACIALALVMLINTKWKISSHTTAFGGLIGCVFGMCIFFMKVPNLTYMSIFMLIALLLMFARIYENAHTPLQTIAGLLLGMFCCFVPYCIYYA